MLWLVQLIMYSIYKARRSNFYSLIYQYVCKSKLICQEVSLCQCCMIISAVRHLPVPKILVLLQSNDLINIPIFDTQNNGGHDGRHLVEELWVCSQQFCNIFCVHPKYSDHYWNITTLWYQSRWLAELYVCIHGIFDVDDVNFEVKGMLGHAAILQYSTLGGPLLIWHLLFAWLVCRGICHANSLLQLQHLLPDKS